jgi:hypothetical protein
MEDKKSPNKIKVEKQIFKHNINRPITWSDIKHLELEDDDIIYSYWVEPYYSDNESYDGHWDGSIIRMVEETDEQFSKRQADIEMDKKWAKERRYQSYLRLKEEFDNE